MNLSEQWEAYAKTRSIELRNQLMMKYANIVKIIANKILGSYQYFNNTEDIINEGMIALLDAIERFDSSKNVKFETFASIKVKGAMIDFIRAMDYFPRRVKKLSKDIDEAYEQLYRELLRTPTVEEVAEKLSMSGDELCKAQQEVYSMGVMSFEQILDEQSQRTTELMSISDEFYLPEHSLQIKELTKVLAQSIDTLNDRERLIISLYYVEQLKIKDISKILEISTPRVSQIHLTALNKLKIMMNEYTSADERMR